MEPRKLTKADIDSVRHIEGFPNATDEDIIALYPSAVYVRFSSNKVKQFNINSGVDLADISSEIVKVFNNKTKYTRSLLFALIFIPSI